MAFLMMKKIVPVVFASRMKMTRPSFFPQATFKANPLVTATAGSSSGKPPPEFPAAPPPDMPTESSEVPQAPSVPDYDRTPQEMPPGPPPHQPKTDEPTQDDPYSPGPVLPSPHQSQTNRVVQPHGAEVKTPILPELTHFLGLKTSLSG
ncbi:unnamed protein product [Cuscuta europaea]|uniref:Uncharacterized protein n=1 Tax=Cuscuta europaea TaxID=41803 RepID=A0A9P0ZL48_CUSEU|nr:unnamed protein product [Cuscuta europaea]